MSINKGDDIMDRILEKVDRNYAVVEMFNEGYRASAIAKRFDITRARVYQIIENYKKKEAKRNGK